MDYPTVKGDTEWFSCAFKDSNVYWSRKGNILTARFFGGRSTRCFDVALDIGENDELTLSQIGGVSWGIPCEPPQRWWVDIEPLKQLSPQTLSEFDKIETENETVLYRLKSV